METVPRQTWRIVDASLNRIAEGLRVLEEAARFVLDDAGLTEGLKEMRHRMVRRDLAFQERLVEARDSAGDVGAEMEVRGEAKTRAMPEIVVANARRVQESLRVMEELAKLPGLRMSPDEFQRARFALYDIEKTLLSRLLRRERLERLSGLYVIIDTQALRGRDAMAVAGQAIRGGASAIQLRDKMLRKADLLALAERLCELCRREDVLFAVNDYLDVALAVEADGLHVGQEDLPVEVARALLPVGKLLGCSARTVEAALAAEAAGADYVAVGSMYPTTTKESAVVVGLDRLRQVKQAVHLPLVAIGGINAENVSDVMAAGADAVAVISAVSGAEDPERASHDIVERIMHGRTGQA